MLVALYIALAVVVLISLFVGFVAISSLVALIQTKGVPYVPLSKKQLQDIAKNIQVNKNDRIIDLGCGDGRVLRLFEQQGAKDLTGYEINLWAYILARIKNKIHHSRANVYCQDFNQINLNRYNIIFCYLLESYLSGLRTKFEQELKPGTKIISYGFAIKNWRQPTQVIHTNTKRFTLGRIFIYTIK
jgi:ribosomal protein L11 methylase PrmA